MIIGIVESQSVHLNRFGVYVVSRATYAQSHQRRFRRWLSNRRIRVVDVHHALIRQALCQWGKERLYLSLDTTVIFNCFCLVWVGVVYRGRTVPVAWRVVAQSSSTVRLWTIQRVLRQAYRLMPDDGVSLGKTRPYGGVYLAFAHDAVSNEKWTIVSDEPTNLQTFAQYQLRFQVEESFLDLKSNGFALQASRLRDKFALGQLCGVIALTMLFLVLQGVEVVASGNRRMVDAHWHRGSSYLKIGWNWIRLAITRHWKINIVQFLPRQADPEPAIASRRQCDEALMRQFIVLKCFPTS